MDTVVSVGTLGAYLWSFWAVLFGPAEMYFETASVVTTFILAGRYLEARSTRPAGAALRSLLVLGAKSVSVLSVGPDHPAAMSSPSGGRD